LIVVAFIGTFGYNFTVVTPLVADNLLKTDAAGFGLLSAAMGIGAFIAAIATAYARTITMRRMLISGALFSVSLGALALSTSFNLSMLLFALLGITGITCATATNSLLQLNTPEQLRGRVLSINVLLAQGSTPIGGLFLGMVGQAAGVGTAIFLCAVICLLGVGIALSYRQWLA
jgi:predicted MFS family arabinose efflux permease